MATAARSLQLCVRSCRARPAAAPRTGPAFANVAQHRPFSHSTVMRKQAPKKTPEQLEEEELYGDYAGELSIERALNKAMSEIKKDEDFKGLSLNSTEMDSLREELVKTRTGASGLRQIFKPARNSFWNEEEEDTDFIADEKEDDFEENDIMSMAHGKLEEHRELREYSRLLVWELPLLAKHAKPFELPPKDAPLRFRYTSYMGEFHPAEKKVVVEFCPEDLDLTDVQKNKLRKLVGTRYQPGKDIVKMSCEKFEHQAQNKRYLGDLVNTLVEQAKDPTDTFEDVPLDTRHWKPKVKPQFPREWRMTEQRKVELQQWRKAAFELDTGKRTAGTFVDGIEKIQQRLTAPPPKTEAATGDVKKDKIAELLAVKPGATSQRPRAAR